MATTKTTTPERRPLTLDDLKARNEKTYLYDVENFGTVEMRGITHGDMLEVRREHEDENGRIKNQILLYDDLARRACVQPPLTAEVIAAMVDAEKVLYTIGQRAGFQCGYLINPPDQDKPKPDPTEGHSAPSSDS